MRDDITAPCQLLHAREVNFHVDPSLPSVKNLTDSHEQPAQALDLLFLQLLDVAEQFFDELARGTRDQYMPHRVGVQLSLTKLFGIKF